MEDFLGASVTTLLFKLVIAVVIILAGNWLAGFVAKLIRRQTEASERIDTTLGNFFASIARYAIILLAILTAAQQAGVDVIAFVGILSALALAVGLALQGTLGNIAAGVMIILFRPYKVGQFIEVAGQAGTVKDIDIFTTELVTVDNVQIVIPNGACWGGTITNYSAHPTRRCDLTFGISYDDDIQKATDAILGVVRADGRFLSSPAEPWVRVVNLGDSSVDLQLRAWVNAADYWEARFAVIRAVKEAFDAQGVEIPYPHSVEIQKTAAG